MHCAYCPLYWRGDIAVRELCKFIPLSPDSDTTIKMTAHSNTVTLVHRAREFATQAHRRIDQRRKYSKQAYEVHLKAVADLVASVTDDQEMIAAAWLHDTIEDTPATLGDIEHEFGTDVAQLVADLTDVSRPGDGNRSVRKAIDRAHSAQASVRAKTVKLADLTDNCRDICEHDERFARVFVVEMAALLEVLREGDRRLYKKAEATLDRCAKRLALPLGLQTMPSIGEQTSDLSEGDREFAARNRRALRLFMRAFSAQDIAEPLRSFDAEFEAGRIADYLKDRGRYVAGLRESGRVKGYVRHQDLGESSGHDYMRDFQKDQVVEGESSLADVVLVLTRHDYCFVRVLDDIVGVISRGEMQKPVVRMWLFGFITTIEMTLRERTMLRWPDGSWTEKITPSRLQKAQALRDERLRRGQECELLDCMQLSDVAKILLAVPEERAVYGFDSTAAVKRVVKEMESLRNNLAHAQDIVTHDWAQIARMARNMEVLAKEGG